ncbi:ER membrane protein complex subunit 2-like [Ylistrum balloti]|uniref:ER membrane protein complex subunit 2-like n=1 Tax=Ylistrum balloti TaxID=509963 RepID=UPI0029059C84|nr:ER membrane protein complex subunit 2-like [Ylistrum balloti]
MARRIGWEEARNILRRVREEQARDGQTVVRVWEEVLMKNRNKLGDELWVVYEQVCIAALDCQRFDLVDACISVLKDNFPKSIRVDRLRGMLYEAQGRFNIAEEVYKSIIDRDETNMFAKKRQVSVLKAQNKIPEAIDKLNSYLREFMTDFEAWTELCDLYLSQQDYQKAAFCIEELIMSNPHNHLYHQKYAEICYTQGNFEQARSYFAQALKLNPNNICRSSSCSLASTSKSKEKQANVKYAAWAAQQLKEKYVTVQSEEATKQTKILETIDRLLESTTEKASN